MVSEIAGALSSLKVAFDMTKAMKDISDATTIQGKVFELQRVILEAQSSAIEAREAHSTQVERIRKLEKEVADLKAWGAEREDYELKTIGHGAFAYMLKPEARGSKPPHWLCQACYEHRKKSILQSAGMVARGVLNVCPVCKSTAMTSRQDPMWLD